MRTQTPCDLQPFWIREALPVDLGGLSQAALPSDRRAGTSAAADALPVQRTKRPLGTSLPNGRPPHLQSVALYGMVIVRFKPSATVLVG